MMMRIDKFLIEELQKCGYEIDYKKLCEIYATSRKNPAYVRRKNARERRKEEDARYAKEFEKYFSDEEQTSVSVVAVADGCVSPAAPHHAYTLVFS